MTGAAGPLASGRAARSSRPRAGLVAIDLGASSARLLAGGLESGLLVAHEVARVSNAPVLLPDGLHWDILGLYSGMLAGLAAYARERGAVPSSIGIDGWAVDYGLLDGGGRLLGLPYHYRDRRTAGRVEQAVASLGPDVLYGTTGIQVMSINTVFQLLAERETSGYQVAARLLMIPDLVAYLLTGESRLERTNASTTQLVDIRTGDLSGELIAGLGLRADLFAPVVEPGEHVGTMLPDIAASVGLPGRPEVVAVASHDTASAVLAVPARSASFAYVVSGTWSLVGLELDTPVLGEASRAANFSNEGGIDGTVRFLKNVMGHWMLQECERSWARAGRPRRLTDLLVAARSREAFASVVDTADARFVEPGDLPARVRDACRDRGELVPADDVALVRCILDSMALAVSSALDEAARLADRDVGTVHVVGGGAANDLLLELIAAAAGREVVAGPLEASAIGNLLVQLRAAGLVRGRDEMRDLVERSFGTRRVAPDGPLVRSAQRAARRLGVGSGVRGGS